MTNTEIAAIFSTIADLLEIKGDNPFRVRSYRNAALSIDQLAVTLNYIYKRDEDELEDIPGVGKGIHEKIVEIIKLGHSTLLDELLREMPKGLLEMLKIPGVGPKKVKLFYGELNISDVDALEKAAQSGELRALPKMGEKSEDKILKGIKNYRSLKEKSGRVYHRTAFLVATEIVEFMKKAPVVKRVEFAGSLRRWQETIGDIDILVGVKKNKADESTKHFIDFPGTEEVILSGLTKTTIRLKGGIQADLRVVDESQYGAALLYFTGSKAHNVILRDMAKKAGMRVNEYGVTDEETGRVVASETEEDMYKALGLEWIEPELREGLHELEAAKKGGLPKLITEKDIKGDLHFHSTYSDGSDSLSAIAKAGIERGLEYIAITDHSKAVGIARGMNEQKLLKQCAEIDKVNLRLKDNGESFTLLKGIEVDILADGTLDMDKDVLSQLDVVVAAVHSGFAMDKDKMTDRIQKAMSSGVVNIHAHPTGRLINIREPYELDIDAVITSAKDHNISLEINSHPERLDLKDSHIFLARERGVKVAISTDSHTIDTMPYMSFGIHNARRGWCEKRDVLNTMSLKKLQSYLKQ